jgi:hypothetical protein
MSLWRGRSSCVSLCWSRAGQLLTRREGVAGSVLALKPRDGADTAGQTLRKTDSTWVEEVGG